LVDKKKSKKKKVHFTTQLSFRSDRGMAIQKSAKITKRNGSEKRKKGGSLKFFSVPRRRVEQYVIMEKGGRIDIPGIQKKRRRSIISRTE